MRNAPVYDEKRRFPRQSHHIPVLVGLKKALRPMPRKMAAVTINVSRNGILLRIGDDFDFAPGDDLDLELLGGGDTDFPSSYNVKLSGKVVRVEGSIVAVAFDEDNENFSDS